MGEFLASGRVVDPIPIKGAPEHSSVPLLRDAYLRACEKTSQCLESGFRPDAWPE